MKGIKIELNKNEIDVKCNIYDMAGNISEWSTESCIDSNTP